MVILPTFIDVLQAWVNYITSFIALDFYHSFRYTFFVTGTETVSVTDFIKIELPEDYFVIWRDGTDGTKANY